MRPTSMALSLVCFVGLGGCIGSYQEESKEANVVGAVTADAKPVGVENFHRLNDRVLSGGEPQNEAAFRSLAAMGVKTIVSADGARPDVEMARKHGINYCHIPIGYDGVPALAAAAGREVMEQKPGAVFVHCHHGVHRGPALAAVMMESTGEWDRARAISFLAEAGTGKEYAGLWRDVGEFDPAAIKALHPPLREVAPVADFPGQMAAIDRTWDRIKLCKESAWKVPADHPDVDPPHEAKILEEGFREAARHEGSSRPQDFQKWLTNAEKLSFQLREAITHGNVSSANGHFDSLKAACIQCHEAYRN